jgi:hypothetical protein
MRPLRDRSPKALGSQHSVARSDVRRYGINDLNPAPAVTNSLP